MRCPTCAALLLAMTTWLVSACDVPESTEGDTALSSQAAAHGTTQNVSLRDAVRAAEAHENGTAIEASVNRDQAAPFYEVSVLRDNRVYEVAVSVADGAIIGSAPDIDD